MSNGKKHQKNVSIKKMSKKEKCEKYEWKNIKKCEKSKNINLKTSKVWKKIVEKIEKIEKYILSHSGVWKINVKKTMIHHFLSKTIKSEKSVPKNVENTKK